MDLAELTNAPREYRLAGRVYKVSALKFREWGDLQAWIKDHVPSPLSVLDSADLEKLSPVDRKTLLAIAHQDMKNWPPRPGSESWIRAIDTDEGSATFLKVVLGKHQPDFTIERAYELVDRLTILDVLPILTMALGLEDPRPKDGMANGRTPDAATEIPLRLLPTETTVENSSGSSQAS